MSYEANNSDARSRTFTQPMGVNDVINDVYPTVEGSRTFIVTDVQQGRYEGNGNMPGCDTMTVSLMVYDGYERIPVRQKFFINRNSQYKLSSFFCCLGMKERGKPFKMDWESVAGHKGKAHFTVREYIDKYGEKRQTSEIDNFFDYDPKYFDEDADIKFYDISDGNGMPM